MTADMVVPTMTREEALRLVEAEDKLRALLAGFREWRTRLTKAAYRKGVEAGLAGATTDDDPPYKTQGYNYAKGGNDPLEAWREGVRDGRRITELLADPAKVFPPISWREAKIVGYDQTWVAEKFNRDHS